VSRWNTKLLPCDSCVTGVRTCNKYRSRRRNPAHTFTVTSTHHQRASLMGITISHRLRTDICEAARFNSRRFLMERNATVAKAGKRHNQLTQWKPVAFATANVMVVLKCLRKNQKVQTNLSWSSLKAHLIETSTFVICATSRFASIAQSTRTLGTAMNVIQRSLGKRPSGNEATRKADIPRIRCQCGR
jgi:hypothetical protein